MIPLIDSLSSFVGHKPHSLVMVSIIEAYHSGICIPSSPINQLYLTKFWIMMASWHGYTFRITCPFCWESIVHRWRPLLELLFWEAFIHVTSSNVLYDIETRNNFVKNCENQVHVTKTMGNKAIHRSGKNTSLYHILVIKPLFHNTNRYSR